MKVRRLALVLFVSSYLVLALFPQYVTMPVEGASARDWNSRSYWASPWGRSGVHKGIDIFASEGSAVRAPTPGIVLFRGQIALGGNVIVLLTSRWRVHYFAHMQGFDEQAGYFVSSGERLGSVGATGNAAGKPPHLHYAVISLIPHLGRWDLSRQGWKKMFYLDPGALLTKR